MKLACIYNVWDGVELLRGSMLCRKNDVDLFIIVYQEISNFGEKYNPLPYIDVDGFNNIVLIKYTPNSVEGTKNEIAKRNLGLNIAKENNCTHFLFSDCDEYFEDFKQAKDLYIKSAHGGSVCKILTYFQKPTLRFKNTDNYYVPFIHKLSTDTTAGVRQYPYYVDPTRRVNEVSVINLKSIFMHHFSWVRRDIRMKVRNSSAKKNIEKSNLIKDYFNSYLKAGDIIKDYDQVLVETKNIFNISLPE